MDGGDGKVKILVLGPVSTGKTSICNFLGDVAESAATGEHRATKGVRIVEFASDAPRKSEIELWDCSGDPKYERCWPALRHNADGIIFVYSRNGAQQRNALAKLYDFFVEGCDFPVRKCTVMFNPRGESRGSEGCPLERLPQTLVDLENKDHELRTVFNAFLESLVE